MGELVGGQLGPEASYSMKFEEGKLKVVVQQDGEMGGAKVEMYLKSDMVLKALKDAIPGHFDDQLIDAAIALLAVKA